MKSLYEKALKSQKIVLRHFCSIINVSTVLAGSEWSSEDKIIVGISL